jgi:hypothetical protein
MKKQYMKPAMQAVPLQYQQQLMTGSPYDRISSAVDTYDDTISDKGDIW